MYLSHFVLPLFVILLSPDWAVNKLTYNITLSIDMWNDERFMESIFGSYQPFVFHMHFTFPFKGCCVNVNSCCYCVPHHLFDFFDFFDLHFTQFCNGIQLCLCSISKIIYHNVFLNISWKFELKLFEKYTSQVLMMICDSSSFFLILI